MSKSSKLFEDINEELESKSIPVGLHDFNLKNCFLTKIDVENRNVSISIIHPNDPSRRSDFPNWEAFRKSIVEKFSQIPKKIIDNFTKNIMITWKPKSVSLETLLNSLDVYVKKQSKPTKSKKKVSIQLSPEEDEEELIKEDDDEKEEETPASEKEEEESDDDESEKEEPESEEEKIENDHDNEEEEKDDDNEEEKEENADEIPELEFEYEAPKKRGKKSEPKEKTPPPSKKKMSIESLENDSKKKRKRKEKETPEKESPSKKSKVNKEKEDEKSKSLSEIIERTQTDLIEWAKRFSYRNIRSLVQESDLEDDVKKQVMEMMKDYHF